VSGETLRIKVGDIVKLQTHDFRKEVQGQFGVTLERYKIIKEKVNGTFTDYNAVVLITTGKLKGQLYHVGPYRLSGLSHHI